MMDWNCFFIAVMKVRSARFVSLRVTTRDENQQTLSCTAPLSPCVSALHNVRNLTHFVFNFYNISDEKIG